MVNSLPGSSGARMIFTDAECTNLVGCHHFGPMVAGCLYPVKGVKDEFTELVSIGLNSDACSAYVLITASRRHDTQFK